MIEIQIKDVVINVLILASLIIIMLPIIHIIHENRQYKNGLKREFGFICFFVLMIGIIGLSIGLIMLCNCVKLITH